MPAYPTIRRLVSIALVVGFVAGVFFLSEWRQGGFDARPLAGPAASVIPSRRLNPDEIEYLFRHPTQQLTVDGLFPLSVRQAGRLRLPTGRIVASDPAFTQEPFTRSFDPGTYTVLVLIADTGKGDLRVTAAIVVAGDVIPARWEIAVTPGEHPASLKPGEVFEYGVDSGTGCFTSAEGAELMNADIAWLDKFWAAIDAHGYPSVGEYLLGGPDGPNVVGFGSGYGDGGYPSFFGLDELGRPVALLTDFGLLDEPFGPQPSVSPSR